MVFDSYSLSEMFFFHALIKKKQCSSQLNKQNYYLSLITLFTSMCTSCSFLFNQAGSYVMVDHAKPFLPI